MSSIFLKELFAELGVFYTPLIKASRSDESLKQFIYDSGWDIEALADNASDITIFLQALKNLVGLLNDLIEDGIQLTPFDIKHVTGQLESLNSIIKSINSLPAILSTTVEQDGFVKSIINFLTISYLFNKKRSVSYFLELIGVISYNNNIIKTKGDNIVYYENDLPIVDFNNIIKFINNPKEHFSEIYWPLGLTNEANAIEAGKRLFVPLANFLGSFNIKASPGLVARERSNSDVNIDQNTWERLQGLLTIYKDFNLVSGLKNSVGATIGIIPISQQGPGFYIAPFGNLQTSNLINNWLVTTSFSSNTSAIRFLGNGNIDVAGLPSNNPFLANVKIQYISTDEEFIKSNKVIIGPEDGTKIEADEITFEVFTQKLDSIWDYGCKLSINSLNFTLKPSDGDSFINSVLPEYGFNIDSSLIIEFSNNNGLHFQGSTGLSKKINLNTSKSKNLLKVNDLGIQIILSENGFETNIGVNFQISIGPLTAYIEQIGLVALLEFGEESANLGLLNASIGFKEPNGIGISIHSDTLTGGGYLYSNPDTHSYSGVANLKFSKTFNLTAVGILQTQLPNDKEGYSLLLLITATVRSIQLGLGFTLNGVGGLVGVNRSANIASLRSLVYSGNIDQLLFPTNILDNPQAVLAIADSSFPSTEGRYVFGLMAKIGWGTPTLITLDAALIIELPEPARLILLGVLKAILPSLKNPILQLRADFLGSVDFGAKTVEFDATLTDSRLLQFVLTGDGAFRLYKGKNPVFLLTTGGFHPDFHPPANANLPVPRRLNLRIADNDDFRVLLEAYFAITSNTVQVGAYLGLFVDLGADFTIEGHVSFDTLIQFNPFRLDTQFSIGLALKYNGKNKLSLYVSLHVTGPARWHVSGEVSFTLIVDFSFRIDRTFGPSKDQLPLPNIDVRSLLKTALADPKNWEVEAAPKRLANTVALKAEPDETRLLIDTSGTLLVQQNIIPLMTRLERYGNARPINGDWFEITKVELGTSASALELTRQEFERVEDFFAIGEFTRLSNASRLSSPSFQLMASGVRLNSLTDFTAGPSTVQKVGYEMVTLLVPQSTSSTIERRKTVDMSAQLFQQLNYNSEVGRYVEHLTPSFQAAEQVYWTEDNYVIVQAATLIQYSPNLYRNESEAVEAMTIMYSADPTMRNKLVIVPGYQLDLESV